MVEEVSAKELRDQWTIEFPVHPGVAFPTGA